MFLNFIVRVRKFRSLFFSLVGALVCRRGEKPIGYTFYNAYSYNKCGKWRIHNFSNRTRNFWSRPSTPRTLKSMTRPMRSWTLSARISSTWSKASRRILSFIWESCPYSSRKGNWSPKRTTRSSSTKTRKCSVKTSSKGLILHCSCRRWSKKIIEKTKNGAAKRTAYLQSLSLKNWV